MKERRGHRLVRRQLRTGAHLLPIPQCENCKCDIEPHRRRTVPAVRLCSVCTWKLRDQVRAALGKSAS